METSQEDTTLTNFNISSNGTKWHHTPPAKNTQLKFNPEKTSDKSKFHSTVGLHCSKMVVSWKSEELEIGNKKKIMDWGGGYDSYKRHLQDNW